MSPDAKKAVGLALAGILVLAAPEVIEILAAALAAVAV